MSLRAELSRDGRTLTLRVPMRFRKRGGRKLIIAPEGAAWAPARPRVDGALVKALARAHRWQRLLESGAYGSISELAKAEKVTGSYVCRLLRLTLLAPDIVEAILDGRQPETLTLQALRKPFPVAWARQRSTLV